MITISKHQKSLGNEIPKTVESLRILFFHNTLPEYRIGWFQKLSEKSDIEFVFTNNKLNSKKYGFGIDYERSKNLKCTFLDDGIKGLKQLKGIIKNIKNFDFVELPPIDSFREAIYSTYIIKQCKKYGVKTGYFWEKWDAPNKVQPIQRKIKNLILRTIPKQVYKYSDVIFAVGKKSKEYFILNGIDENKISIIPNASETPPCEYINIRKQYGITPNKKVIMYLGRMMPQKGVRYLIDAFCRLESHTRKDCHLLIAGDGEDLTECKKVAKECGIENITFTGAIEPRIRGNYFSQCDIFVYPVTYYRGWVDVWGLTLNEAVQHGKIVIATDAVGSAFELIEDGVNGYRVEPQNVCELLRALQKSLDSNMIKTAKTKNAELFEKFCFSNMAKQYINQIQLLLGRNIYDS